MNAGLLSLFPPPSSRSNSYCPSASSRGGAYVHRTGTNDSAWSGCVRYVSGALCVLMSKIRKRDDVIRSYAVLRSPLIIVGAMKGFPSTSLI